MFCAVTKIFKFLLLLWCLSHTGIADKPHLILIVADDLGWNDVSWHNPDVITPNLESLANSGIILTHSYVQPICTPTRSALLSGRYPFTMGRQHGTIHPLEPKGLTLNVTLLPQELKKHGYSTYAVGKWHLGYCKWDYTPTSRGFDYFTGYYTGSEDYFTHCLGWIRSEDQPYGKLVLNCNFKLCINTKSLAEHLPSEKESPLDFRNNTSPYPSAKGTYSTYIFASRVEEMLRSRNSSSPMFLYMPFQSVHSPLEVPLNYTLPYSKINDVNRRTYLGMVTAMDEAVGRIVKALKETNHYNNSVIVFTTDNGGPTSYGANNWPLRGNKTTMWEGGTRGVAFVHSPLLPSRGFSSDLLIHATDWYPTFLGLAGGSAPLDIDGIDQWKALIGAEKPKRKEVVYNIDETTVLSAGIRLGNFKLLVGYPGPGDWTPPPTEESNDIFFVEELKSKEVHLESLLKEMGTIRQYIASMINETESPLRGTPEHQFLEQSKMLQLARGVEDYKKKIQSHYENLDLEVNPGMSVFSVALNEGIKMMRKEKKGIEENNSIQKNSSITSSMTSKRKIIKKKKVNSKVKKLFKKIMKKSNSRSIREVRTWPILTPLKELYRTVYTNRKNFSKITDGKLRLFNIRDDPDEIKDIAQDNPKVVKLLLKRLLYHEKRYVPADIAKDDPNGNPKYWDNVFSPGWC